MENCISIGKTERILMLYSRLKQGDVLNKADLASEFHVDARTIQRDVDDIRVFFSNGRDGSGQSYDVVYDRKENGFRLQDETDKMTARQLLVVCKVLLESRAFTKKELELLLSKLINNCAGASERKIVENLIANERHHYCELQHHTELIDRIWELGNAVKSQRYISVVYRKVGQDEYVERLLKPVGITFSEFYFYLVAFIEPDEQDEKYLSPAIYRIDRIQSYDILERHFSVPYAKRFEEGEFRKRIQFMFGGKLQRIVFKYSGQSPEAVLDRFPTAVILNSQDGVYTIRAEVYGNGVDVWLRSQGDDVEVVSRMELT